MLSYCTNIHTAESWSETFAGLQQTTLQVRDGLKQRGILAAGQPYEIGLRLSALAARELLQRPGELPRFASWLQQHECRVSTINGFPYGAFSRQRVKTKVFLPDWSSVERLEYTKQLFEILLFLNQDSTRSLTVSTLPLGHKCHRFELERALQHVGAMDRWLEQMQQKHGRELMLGFEPEPWGHFERCDDSIATLQQCWQAGGIAGAEQRLGLTYDCCHMALQYLSAAEALQAFAAAGVRIVKLHYANALGLHAASAADLCQVQAFDEPVYSHQCNLRLADARLLGFVDVPQALQWARSFGRFPQEWRVHFHIPLYAEPQPPLFNTSAHVTDVLALLQEPIQAGLHGEIETYTWSVLPESMQQDMVGQICREYEWLLQQGFAGSLD